MFYDVNELKDTHPALLVLWPAVLSLLAVVIWYLGYRKELEDERAPWKWLGLIALAAALAIGASALFTVFSGDFALIADQLGRRPRFALYIAGGVPIAALAAVVGLSIFQRIENAQRF